MQVQSWLPRVVIVAFVVAGAGLGAVSAARPAAAATVGAGFTDAVFAGGLNAPTAMTFAPDGRIFVAQQGGALRVIKNGALLATPFLTVTTDPTGERGLLGVAFDPAFATNSFVYVYYTATTPLIHNRVSRFTANGDLAVAGSEIVIMDLPALSAATNHNGGAIHFGPDGKLYIAVGENANAPLAQDMTSPMGKMLRVNKDGTIPSDNPFFSSTTGQARAIWALGLRNPFTFAFQPGTGRMFINDVGAGAFEEINDGVAGSNYGWPDTEGLTSDPDYRSPLLAYGHGAEAATGCAIAGGAFYNPPAPTFPEAYDGTYFYADLCSGWVRNFNPNTGTSSAFAQSAGAPVDLAVGPDGALYYLSRGGNLVGRIAPGPRAVRWGFTPMKSGMPAASTVSFAVTFRNTGTLTWPSGGPNPVRLSYHWHNGNCPGGASVVFDGLRTNLPSSVAPGGTVSDLVMTIAAPASAGSYCLEMDVVQEGEAWFESAASGTRSFSVSVGPAPRATGREPAGPRTAPSIPLESGAGAVLMAGSASGEAGQSGAPDVGTPQLPASSVSGGAANGRSPSPPRTAITPPNTGDGGIPRKRGTH